MTAVEKRKLFKTISIIAFIVAAVFGITYLIMANNEKTFIKNFGGYVKSYEKVNDKYEANVVFFKNGEVELEKKYVYESEPKIGDTEILYYLTFNKDNYLEKEPNLYVTFVWMAIVAGVALVTSIVAFVGMKSIRARRNAKVSKKIKVDEKSMLKK